MFDVAKPSAESPDAAKAGEGSRDQRSSPMPPASAESPPRIRRFWLRHRSLTAQFSAVSSAVLLLGMLVQGAWISAAIEENAKYHAGSAAAMFVEHVIAPFFVQLPPGAPLSPEHQEAVDALMRRASERMHIAAIKVWTPGGTILYSTNAANIGQTFETTPALRRALDGAISVELDVLEDAESEWERRIGVPLIEVYVPIRDQAGRVVAVAEFYENAEILNRELQRSQRDTWMVTGVVFLAMIASLLVIVSRGSRLIDQQRRSLTDQVRQLSDLQSRVERASKLAAEESEQYLHRLGADLHDGPAQLISFALLRLDAMAPGCVAAESDFVPVRGALTDAMNEVRSICAGLSMPGIATLPCSDAIASTIKEYERRTGMTVSSRIAALPASTPHFVKTGLCRFVQEGLNNAFRHAGGAGQTVTAAMRDGAIVVEVADRGPGMAAPLPGNPGRLGLVGLTNRLETLGGTVQIRTVPGRGTWLTATMPIASWEGSPAS